MSLGTRHTCPYRCTDTALPDIGEEFVSAKDAGGSEGLDEEGKRGKSGQSGGARGGDLFDGRGPDSRKSNLGAYRSYLGRQPKETNSEDKRDRSTIELVAQPAPASTIGTVL